MRYFAELSYRGTNYYGWQRQPGQISIQETIESAISTILRTETPITGCGRTDTGVHAKQYFMHFDFDGSFPKAFDRRINKYIGPDIALYSFWQVDQAAHARFDATHRAYEYHLNFQKHPFEQETAYFYPFADKLNIEAMQEAGKLLLGYSDFYPFCKSDTDVKTMKCELRQAEWKWHAEEKKLVFHIAANRFLRGMVRLIVGMCLNVGIGKLSLSEVRQAMDQQSRIVKSLSVPPQGLFLTDIRYPFLSNHKSISF